MNKPDSTHFGFREVAQDDKARLVGEVFSSVARTVVNWQTPLHRRATRIPRGSRPPPAWAATWSIC